MRHSGKTPAWGLVLKDQRGIKYMLYLGMNTVDFIFLKINNFVFVLMVIIPVSSTQPLKTSGFKVGDSPEPALILERENEANQQGGQQEPKRETRSNPQGKPGPLILQGQPGYSNQPGKPENFKQKGRPGVFNQPGSLQGNSGQSNQKGNPEASNEQGKPGSFNQQGKPGSSSQKGKPGLSSQQRKSKSFYNQEERKTGVNPLNDNTMEIQVSDNFSFFSSVNLLQSFYFLVIKRIHCTNDKQLVTTLI